MSKQGASPARADKFDLAGRGFVLVWDFMGQDLGLKNSDLIVYARIFGFENAGKTFYESKSGTARFFGLTERAVFDAVKRLKGKGLIEEVEPCEESLRIGSKCYRPCPEPLASVGVSRASHEEPSYEDDASPEEASCRAPDAPEEPSWGTPDGHEADASEEVQEVHPIPKNHNRHFE